MSSGWKGYHTDFTKVYPRKGWGRVYTARAGLRQENGYHVRMIEVSFLPIFFAGVASIVIGFAWYHPKVFGGAWMRLSNLSPEAVEKVEKTFRNLLENKPREARRRTSSSGG